MATEFENFLTKVAAIEHVQDDPKLNAERDKLKADPVTAWALATLSAQRMRKLEDSTDNKSWLHAQALWRAVPEIVEEMKREKALDARLMPTPSREDKAKGRQREADAAFKTMAGTPVDNPNIAALAALIGPQSTIAEKLGEKLATEALAALASSKDINMLLPMCQAFIDAGKLFDTPCQKYLAWESRRDIVAKGEKKVFGLVTKVDKEELKRANDAMAAIEAKDPMVKKMLAFRKLSAEALKAHNKTPEDATSISQINACWEQIIEANKEMAQYTLKVRDQKKQEQLDRGAGVDKAGQQSNLGKRDTRSTTGDFNKNAPIPLDESRLGKGSLLTDADVNLIAKKDNKAKQPKKK